MKHEPCTACGRKPKVYKEEFNGEWYLDHNCPHLGVALAGDCKSDVVIAWNKRMSEHTSGKYVPEEKDGK